MNIESIQSLSEKAATGRAVNPSQVRLVSKRFATEYLRQTCFTDARDNIAYDGIADFLDLIYYDGKVLPTGELMEYYLKRQQRVPHKSDLLALLSIVGADTLHPENMHPLFSLPLQDYLECAGKEEWYRKWFRNDALAWERDHNGKHPRVCDVLRQCCFYFEGNKDPSVPSFLPDAEVRLLPSEYIDVPFRRRSLKIKDYAEGALAATWVVILMMEIPSLYARENRRKYPETMRLVLKMKGEDEYGKEEKP